jgi:hypothetical protein
VTSVDLTAGEEDIDDLLDAVAVTEAPRAADARSYDQYRRDRADRDR